MTAFKVQFPSKFSVWGRETQKQVVCHVTENTEEAQKRDHSSDLDASYFLQSRGITEGPNNRTV